tara:strand:+ start:663 stop:806 length:144 start_codon:yes stop_codon:yes gene_type:complete
MVCPGSILSKKLKESNDEKTNGTNGTNNGNNRGSIDGKDRGSKSKGD